MGDDDRSSSLAVLDSCASNAMRTKSKKHVFATSTAQPVGDAVELFARIARGSRPADYEIAAYFRERHLRDFALRGRIAELVYAAFRRAPYYAAVVDGAISAGIIPNGAHVTLIPLLAALDTGDDDARSRARVLPALGVLPKMFDALAAWYRGHRSLEFLADDGLDRFAALHAFPLWIVEELAASATREELAALLDGLSTAPPLCIRVNTYKTSVDDAERLLEGLGFSVRRGALSPSALYVGRERDIFATAAFREGLYEVQDEGSQVVSMLVGARRSSRVLDLCAGSGGKSLHLGALMRGRGEIFAYDTDARRLTNMTRRLRRSGLQNVRVIRDAERFADLEDRESGAFDRVLVDAPCSGLGAVRRAPDIKLRLRPELADAMTTRQEGVLRTAARFVGAHGRLIYATCSILPRENESVVASFLEEHPSFRALAVADVMDDSASNALRDAAAGSRDLMLAPHSHGTDGFYVAVLERQPATR